MYKSNPARSSVPLVGSIPSFPKTVSKWSSYAVGTANF